MVGCGNGGSRDAPSSAWPVMRPQHTRSFLTSQTHRAGVPIVTIQPSHTGAPIRGLKRGARTASLCARVAQRLARANRKCESSSSPVFQRRRAYNCQSEVEQRRWRWRFWNFATTRWQLVRCHEPASIRRFLEGRLFSGSGRSALRATSILSHCCPSSQLSQ